MGAKFTMNMPFYTERLAARGIAAIVPEATDQEEVNRVIYDELVRGRILDSSRKIYGEIISRLKENGAEGVILGCTEIPLLVSEKDTSLPLFDTAVIHAQKALDYAVSGKA